MPDLSQIFSFDYGFVWVLLSPSAPCPEGTRIFQKPTASSEGAQLWDRHHLTLSWFRKAGPTIILNIIVDASVPLRGTIGVEVSHVSTAALLRSLQWVSWYGSRSAEPAAHTQSACCPRLRGYHSITLNQLLLHLLAYVGAWLRRDAIASYDYPFSVVQASTCLLT